MEMTRRLFFNVLTIWLVYTLLPFDFSIAKVIFLRLGKGLKLQNKAQKEVGNSKIFFGSCLQRTVLKLWKLWLEGLTCSLIGWFERMIRILSWPKKCVAPACRCLRAGYRLLNITEAKRSRSRSRSGSGSGSGSASIDLPSRRLMSPLRATTPNSFPTSASGTV